MFESRNHWQKTLGYMSSIFVEPCSQYNSDRITSSLEIFILYFKGGSIQEGYIAFYETKLQDSVSFALNNE